MRSHWVREDRVREALKTRDRNARMHITGKPLSYRQRARQQPLRFCTSCGIQLTENEVGRCSICWQRETSDN